jgi:hypothetical protein
VHAFDRRLMLRAFAFTLLALVVTGGVVIATDEPFSTWPMRAARLAAFLPALAAIGAAAALAQSRARGELRALAALGASPWRVTLGATVAGWLAGAISVSVLLSPLADVRSLFPGVVVHAVWKTAGAALVDAAHGVRVEPSGAILLLAAHGAPAIARGASSFDAALAIAPLALLAPPWACAPLPTAARLIGALGTIALIIVLLHAVAAGRITAGWLVLGGVVLAAQAAIAHRTPSLRRGVLRWP